VDLKEWRGDDANAQPAKEKYASYNELYYLLKEEVLPNGEKKTIIKHKVNGSIERL
jgi:hypothetical protein